MACTTRTGNALAAAKANATEETIEELKDCVAAYMPRNEHTEEAKALLVRLTAKV